MVSAKSSPREQLAPEGGWGYMVGLGMALSLTVMFSPAPSFGLIFGEFLESIGEETSAITLINGVFFSSLSLSALIANSLFKKFSFRTVGVIGGLFYFTGSFLTIFVISLVQMIITYAVFQGIGLGLIIPVAFSSFNTYFVEKRATMMAISQTLIGMGSMVFPILTQSMMENYGFRGTVAIIAAMNLHVVFGMMLMHPVEWHWKKPKVALEMDTIKDNSKNGSVDALNSTTVLDSHQSMKAQSQERTDEHEEPLLAKKGVSKAIIVHALPDRAMKDIEKGSRPSSPLRMLKEEEYRVRSRSSSIASLGNWTGPVVVSDSVDVDRKATGKLKLVVDFLDLTLLKDWIYVNMVAGIGFALFSDITFFTLQPLYLMTLGWSKANIAICISTGATADLASRTFLAISSICIKTSSRNVYTLGAIITVIGRIGFNFVSDFTAVLIMTAFIGFFRTWLHVPIPLVFGEYFSQKRFPSAYGLFMFLQGGMMFALGPIVGFIRDYTQSYIMCFNALTVCVLLCALPWAIEAAIFKCKPQTAVEDK